MNRQSSTMSSSYKHSVSVRCLLAICPVLYATARAQVSSFPASADACNTNLIYPCAGVELCCPLPAVCIPDSSSGTVQYTCIDAAGFPADNGPASVPNGGAPIPTTTVPVVDGVGPVVTPSPSPPVVQNNGGSVTSPLPLPPVSPFSPISSPSTTTTSTIPSATPLAPSSGPTISGGEGEAGGSSGNNSGSPSNGASNGASAPEAGSSSNVTAGSTPGNSNGNTSGNNTVAFTGVAPSKWESLLARSWALCVAVSMVASLI